GVDLDGHVGGVRLEGRQLDLLSGAVTRHLLHELTAVTGAVPRVHQDLVEAGGLLEADRRPQLAGLAGPVSEGDPGDVVLPRQVVAPVGNRPTDGRSAGAHAAATPASTTQADPARADPAAADADPATRARSADADRVGDLSVRLRRHRDRAGGIRIGRG